MIYLNPESRDYIGFLGDDSFWLWLEREFDGRWDVQNATKDDIVLQYSVNGPYSGPAKSIACCWELYPEMERVLPPDGTTSSKAERCRAAAQATPFRTIPTAATQRYYPPAKILPIAIDTDVFTPLDRKPELRKKFGIPLGSSVVFWSGTTHQMKGFDLLEQYAAAHPHIFWIIVWKQSSEAGRISFPGLEAVAIKQPQMNMLMNCADFVLSTGRLYPLALVEWEAMAAGLPLVNAPGVSRELPEGSSRHTVFDMGWDRHSAKVAWTKYLEEVAAA